MEKCEYVKIRLKREEDMDIISRYLDDLSVLKVDAVKAVESLMDATPYVISVPQRKFRIKYKGYLKPIIVVYLKMPERCMNLLKQTKKRLRQSFIKMCIRRCMERLPHEYYLERDELEFSLSEFEEQNIKKELGIAPKKKIKRPNLIKDPFVAKMCRTIYDEKMDELHQKRQKERAERKAAEEEKIVPTDGKSVGEVEADITIKADSNNMTTKNIDKEDTVNVIGSQAKEQLDQHIEGGESNGQ